RNSVRLPSRRLSLPETIAQKQDASPLIFLDCLREARWHSRRFGRCSSTASQPEVDTRSFIAARLAMAVSERRCRTASVNTVVPYFSNGFGSDQSSSHDDVCLAPRTRTIKKIEQRLGELEVHF